MPFLVKVRPIRLPHAAPVCSALRCSDEAGNDIKHVSRSAPGLRLHPLTPVSETSPVIRVATRVSPDRPRIRTKFSSCRSCFLVWVKEANPNTKERTKMNKEQSKQLISKQQANTVLQGDCVNLMRQFRSGSVDFVLTDPPYLAHYRSRDGRTVANDNDAAWLKPAFAEMFRVLCRDSFCVSFYGWHQADKFIAAWREAGFRLAGHLTFPKQYASTERFLQYRHENAYLLAKGNPQPPTQRIPDVLEWKYSGNKLHPTQKPLCVLTPLIQCFSQPGDFVLDPFCGSGSTLLAAKLQGRSFIGIELDPAYYNIALDRLRPKAA
jgi:DNA modification methylase